MKKKNEEFQEKNSTAKVRGLVSRAIYSGIHVSLD
jgi:hypothetical protein